jgi:type IV secretory pathway VirB10-like protein
MMILLSLLNGEEEDYSMELMQLRSALREHPMATTVASIALTLSLTSCGNTLDKIQEARSASQSEEIIETTPTAMPTPAPEQTPPPVDNSVAAPVEAPAPPPPPPVEAPAPPPPPPVEAPAPPPPPPLPMADGVLKYGERDPAGGPNDIARYQGYLAMVCGGLPKTGNYLDQSVALTKGYQRAAGLRVDGVAGPETRSSVQEDARLGRKRRCGTTAPKTTAQAPRSSNGCDASNYIECTMSRPAPGPDCSGPSDPLLTAVCP